MNNLKKITHNCQKATLLIEKKQLTNLTIRERFELKVHLSGCSACQLFQRQSQLINKHLKKLLHFPKQHEHSLGDAYKEVLQKQIEEKLT